MTVISDASLDGPPGVDLGDFKTDLTRVSVLFWGLLGQARSKCEHIARAPLSPELWEYLHALYLVKGVHATTAIEGNTLSEEQVLDIYRRQLTLPPSRAYQEQEVRNVLDAINNAMHVNVSRTPLTVMELNAHNGAILSGLDREEHVQPGSLRAVTVSVGRYRCPPPGDVAFLLQRFVAWYNAFPEQIGEFDAMSTAIVKAIAAHVYFVLIHPYGDGNGRTARLLEWRTLDAAGIATPATHLLSNHYNLTRSRYYSMLDLASGEGNLTPFYEYAIRGFVDQLDEQLTHFHEQYSLLVYSDIVRARTPGKSRELVRRREHLAVAIRKAPKPVPRIEVRTLTPHLARLYAGADDKTIARDLSALEDARLILRSPAGYTAVMDGMFWRHQRGTHG